MNDAQHTVYSAYLRQLADRMGLRDWRIALMREPPQDSNGGASCCVFYGRKHAEIRFSHDFMEYAPEKQRHYCTHELLHCHFDAIETMFMGMADQVAKPIYALAKECHHDAVEFALDAIAVSFAHFLALPPEGDDDDS